MKLKVCEAQHITPGYRLNGFIFDDSRGKFSDGEMVTTSSVKEVKNGKLYTASGSEYELEIVNLEQWVVLCSNDQ